MDETGKESQAPNNKSKEKLDALHQEKQNTITELEEKCHTLLTEVNGAKRTWDNLKDVNSLLRLNIEELSANLAELKEKEKENKEKITKLEVMNDELVLRNRTMQARLEELEPRLMKEDVIISPI
ncbi:hypothetical protein LguiA_003352 [Lonicera macranthoides]